MVPGLTAFEWVTVQTLASMLGLVVYVVMSVARRQRRSPSAAIAWVLLLVVAPYIALPLFLVFGCRKVIRAPREAGAPKRAAIESTRGPGARTRALARSMALPDAAPYEQLVIHRDGAQALERLERLAREARQSLDISTFVFGRDAVGHELSALLASRARDGVRVRLLLDGAGRFLNGMASLHELRAAGVEVALFGTLSSWPLNGGANLRNHRKMAIADGRRLWTGGRNLAAEYFVGTRARGRSSSPWIDLTFDFQGPIAAQAGEQFERDWAIATGAKDVREQSSLPKSAEGHDAPLAQLLPSGPDHANDTLYELILDACFGASQRIIAVTPYFVPDAALVMALGLAARRGVKVELILPARSNHRLADLSRPPAVRELLDAGVIVWLTPGMLHGKLVVVDDTMAMAGSLNLDSRSLFLNYEMMIAFYEREAIGRFVEWAEMARSGARRARRRQAGAVREVGEGMLRWLTFQL